MLSPVPRARIAGIGAYAPERVLTNEHLEDIVDTSDEWISERTGIRQRRVAALEENTSDLALKAARRALEHAGVTAADLDMIIVGTVTPDQPFPACAAFLQQKLGAGTIPSFDVSAACAGFLYGLSIGDQFIRTGTHETILVVGVELLSRIMNWQDRTTCILFGDGAGAAVLKPANGSGSGITSTRLYTDSTLADSLGVLGGGSALPLTEEALAANKHKVHMNGSDIFKVAVRNLTSASRAALDDAQLEAHQIDWVVPHQANTRIIAQVSQRLGIPLERFVLNIERYGNTSSASIPIALDEAIRDGRIQPGQRVLMCALGAGVSWASAVVTI